MTAYCNIMVCIFAGMTDRGTLFIKCPWVSYISACILPEEEYIYLDAISLISRTGFWVSPRRMYIALYDVWFSNRTHADINEHLLKNIGGQATMVFSEIARIL